ncbi:MAG: 4-alpha-glucanotransferase, partial [Alphaproteobacteria bacterium]|nr:4-alpha-glucanotransferase [Alphaproteobacteria bacterium]
MSDFAIRQLARSAGLHVEWTDANGRPQEVGLDTLRTVLKALGFAAETAQDAAESHRRLDTEAKAVPKLIATCGFQTVHAGNARRARIKIQNSEWQDIALEPLKVGGVCFRAPDIIGYHELQLDDAVHILAVAPARCFGISDLVGARKLSGLAVQLYSLRGGQSAQFGDFAALGEFAEGAGHQGAEALAVSPTHAGFGAEPDGIAPYSPSSRFFMDPLYADLSVAGAEIPDEPDPGDDLIEWRRARAHKYAQLRNAYERIANRLKGDVCFSEFCTEGGERLRNHAIFEALDTHFRKQGKHSWRDWPRGFDGPSGSEVRAFSEREEREIEYQLFLQWITALSAGEAQARAKKKMSIGIIADMAVGLSPTGSHAWSAPHELLGTLSIGAPPDTFNPAGQDWGLTNFSPNALRSTGFDSFIQTVRAAMKYAGGVRIDHAMGLRRLWVIPNGGSP